MKNRRDITIYDVARALNISPSTVSRGLKDHPHIKKETVRRIKAEAIRMGYRQNKFASNLRLKRTNTLGLVVPKLNSWFMATVIAGIEKVTNEEGYGLIISTSQESEIQELVSVTTLFNSRVDGLMVSLAFNTRSLDHFDILLNKDIPVVFFDRVMPCPSCLSIVIDNLGAAFEVTSHLIDQGCKRIVFVGGNLLRNVYKDRLNGYKKALRSRGIEFNKDLVMISDLTRESGKDAARKILDMEIMPDGIFTSNDTSAVGVIMELLKEGIRIPGDICVAGFNDEPVSQVIQPNLTTVHYPAGKIGEIVARSLINKLKSRNPEKNIIVVGHKIVIRESTLRINN